MTLLDAPSFNAGRARKRRNIILFSLLGLLIVGVFLWIFWNWPAEHRVNRFFTTLEQQDAVLPGGRDFGLEAIGIGHPAQGQQRRPVADYAFEPPYSKKLVRRAKTTRAAMFCSIAVRLDRLSVTSSHRFRSQDRITTRWENPHHGLRREIADV